MSLIGQLHPHYGKKDTTGVLKDFDLVLGLGIDHPELGATFEKARNRAIAILSANPEKGGEIRNSLFRAKDILVAGITIAPEKSTSRGIVDKVHGEYNRLQVFRELFLKNPKDTLERLIYNIEQELRKYPIKKDKINLIGEMAGNITDENFDTSMSKLESHVEKIALLEACVKNGKVLEKICTFVSRKREDYADKKADSMEYWDYTNVANLATTRIKMSTISTESARSFVLSGGGGNGFAQLGVIYEYLKNGGKIKSISGTSMGATIAVIVGKIGNNPEKIRELMDDLIKANQDGSMPEKLAKNENQMLDVFHTLRDKYGIHEGMKFSDLEIPVIVNAGRQYDGGEQEIILGGNEEVIPSILASMNVPLPHTNKNRGIFGETPIHDTNLIDYAANERGNPTHWLELLGEKQKDIVVIDVGYSSENGGNAIVRRLFQRATIRDFLAKLRIVGSGGVVMDAPLLSEEGYSFPPGAIERFFTIGETLYKEHFTSPPSP